MRHFKILTAALGAALLVAACGGGDGGPAGAQNSSPAPGELMQSPPPRITAMTAADFTAMLHASSSGQGLLQLAGTPVCGVDVQYIKYGTVGGAGEATDASGALMVPTGTDPKCTGARSIVLYAHGTNISKRFNMADLADSTNPAFSEASLVAAMFAAQGYIVVAPNYAGYDSSSLSYHPYINAAQQSHDMMDALTAAKAALPKLMSPTTASAKLFVTGYSQGGFVAMATVRALQAANIPVTASAPMSGPYALAAYTDFIFMGGVPLGSTAFAPLMTTSFQKAYGNLYSSPSDIFESAFASGIESLEPGPYNFTTVYSSGKLPQTALFSSTPPAPSLAPMTPLVTGTASDPLFALGVGSANLIKNSVRLSFLTDAMTHGFDGALPQGLTGAAQTLQLATGVTNPLRLAAQRNDLRTGWTGPAAPMLMCGGNADPTVFYSINTQVMGAVWGAKVQQGLVTLLDVDSLASSPGAGLDPFYAAKAGFAQSVAATKTAAGTDPSAQAMAVITSYHGGLVAPFCTAAARGFFSQF